MEATLYIPMLVIIFANVLYHNLAKITPPEANAFLSLAVAYGVAPVDDSGLILCQRTKTW